MLLRFLISWISVLAILFFTGKGNAQCFSFTQSQIPPNSSFIVPLIIEGAALNDLSTIDQCVEAVALSFSHPRVSELEIYLISPFGDTVALVSGGGSTFSATNNTNWNITFLPCSEMAFPDNDFNPNFTNTENWGVFGNYSGLYYPFENCLEDFDEGPVNGAWQLLIINNSEFNSGSLTGFSLFFCNGDGLDCFICQATQSTISLDSTSYCLGSNDLLLDFNRTFFGLAPDPGLYGYDYLLFQDSVLLNNGPLLDLRDSTSGVYTVCGLSYLLEDTLSLLELGDKIDFDDYRFTLTSDTASYCGRLSNCLNIQINETIDTTFINQYICLGDTLFLGTDTLLTSGTYDAVLPSSSVCDSIVQVDLLVLEMELENDITVGLNCNFVEQILTPDILSSNIDPAFMNYIWTGPDGDTLSFEDSLVVTEPGTYQLVVNIVIDEQLLCEFQSNYIVIAINEEYEPQLELSSIFCPFETYEITLDEIVPDTEYTWSVSPIQDIVGPLDSSIFTFIVVDDTDALEICVFVENDCFQDTLICNSISVNQPLDVDIVALDTVCGLSTILNTIGLEEVSAIVVAGPSSNVDFDVMDSDVLVSVVDPGEYTFEVYGLNNGCPFYSLVTVFFIGLPDVNFDIDIVNDCIDPGISIIVDNLTSDEFLLFGSLNAVPFDFTIIHGQSTFDLDMIISGQNTIILDFYQYVNFPSCNFELSQEITTEFSTVVIFPDIVPICNDTIGDNLSSIDFSTLFNVPVVISSIQSDGFEGEILLPLVDFLNVQPGEYVFEVVIDPGSGCPIIDSTIRVEVLDCSCPALIGGNITYDFCGTAETILNDFVVGDWSIEWGIVSTPTGALLNIVNGAIDFVEFRPGLYEFSGVIENVPDGCDPNLTLLLNASNPFNSGEPIQEDTILMCLMEDQNEVQLFDYIQNYDLNGLWIKTSEEGISGSLDSLSGIYDLMGFGKTTASFAYIALNGDECEGDTTIINLIIYKPIDFIIPNQFMLSCSEPVLEIDIERYLNIDGWELNLTTLAGDFIYFNNGNSIRIDSVSVIQFEFISEKERCNTLHEVSVAFTGSPISDIDLALTTPICISDDKDGIIEIMEIFGGQSPFEVQLNEATLIAPPYIFDNLSSGSYLIEIMDSNGCTFDTLVQLELEQTGFVSLGDDIFVTSGVEIKVDFETNISDENIVSVIWELDGEVICDGCSEVSIFAAQGQKILLSLTDTNGCLYRDSLFVFANIRVPFYLPNAFTPTLDNINELLLIYPREGLIEILEWKIFDRWGSAVFETGPFNPFQQEIGWDGQFRGQSALPGIYLSSVRYLLSNGRSVYHVSEVILLK